MSHKSYTAYNQPMIDEKKMIDRMNTTISSWIVSTVAANDKSRDKINTILSINRALDGSGDAKFGRILNQLSSTYNRN